MNAVCESEKRTDPRISASGDISFVAHWQSTLFGDELSASTYVDASVINTSSRGMCIKTSFPLTKNDVLERVIEFQSHIKESAAVKWVEKKDSYYYAGILYLADDKPKPKTARQ